MILSPSAPGTPRSRKLLCLTGFMGSGKTTVGRVLARQIGWHFIDLDSLIEETAGLTIAEIFERRGEPAFRDIEHETLSRVVGEATESGRPSVIALGGGTFAQPRNRELLRTAGSTVIWLDCSVEKLLSRLAGVKDRPLFSDEPSFRRLYEERLPSYLLADVRVEGAADPRRVMEEILALQVCEQLIPR